MGDKQTDKIIRYLSPTWNVILVPYLIAMIIYYLRDKTFILFYRDDFILFFAKISNKMRVSVWLNYAQLHPMFGVPFSEPLSSRECL